MYSFFNYPSGIPAKSNKLQRFKFWRWYLTTAVLNLVDVENMDANMETSFKISLLLGGRVAFFRRDGNLWALPFASAGDVPVYMGQIIKILVTNPVLGEFTGTPGLDCECVYLTPLDRIEMGCGYTWLINECADALSDNDLTVKCVQFLKRLPTIFIAHTDTELSAVQAVINAILDGDMEIVAKSPLDKSVQRLDAGQSITPPLSEFTEYQQYKLGQFYGMLGVNSAWNTKREKVTAEENRVSGETARYNIADVVDSIEQQLSAVNDRFGTNYHCKLSLITSAEIDKEISDAGGENDVEQMDNTGGDDVQRTDD